MNLRSRLSLLVIQIFIISLMLALLGRLFYLQVAAAPPILKYEGQKRTAMRTVLCSSGRVDRHNKVGFCKSARWCRGGGGGCHGGRRCRRADAGRGRAVASHYGGGEGGQAGSAEKRVCHQCPPADIRLSAG